MTIEQLIENLTDRIESARRMGAGDDWEAGYYSGRESAFEDALEEVKKLAS